MRTILQSSLLAGCLCLGMMAQAPAGGGGGGAQRQPEPVRTHDMSSADAGNSASAKMNDKKFIKEAAMGGMMEVELGKVAAQKGSSDSVKQFGQKMVDDHTKANDELKQIASAESVTIPDSLDPKHQAMIAKMSKLSGPDFDKAYVKNMVKDHQKDVSDFQNEAQNGTDPNVKQFAAKTLPVLQGHLSSIQEISNTAAK